MTDESLVRACQTGDREAFSALYDRYIKKIYTYVYYKTHHKETAEDLTAKTFIKALEHIDSCDPDQRFGAWLYRIARNTVIDHYRTARPALEIDDAWDIPDTSDIARDADARQRLAAVRAEVQALPSVQRDILMLRLWEGLSYQEIAQIVQKSEGHCKVIFSRAIRQLRAANALAAFLIILYATHSI
ncbi:RNA polymerase sigma factor [Candidatus Parcubacteria bacterium]|nr:MAG: RNA polymerase sigma factor [Candidatus Parcubacteria bacterium]